MDFVKDENFSEEMLYGIFFFFLPLLPGSPQFATAFPDVETPPQFVQFFWVCSLYKLI